MKFGAALLAATFLTAPAYAQRAVHIDGNTYMFESGGINAVPPSSYEGVVSFHYCNTILQPGIIVATTTNPINIPGVQVSLQPLFGVGQGLRLDIILTPSGPDTTLYTPALEATGLEHLPLTGCHHIAATWSIDLGQVQWSLDGVAGHWDTRFTNLDRSTASFKVNYANAPGLPAYWFIGATTTIQPRIAARPRVPIGPLGSISAFLGPTVGKYAGDLSELYLHESDNDYNNILHPARQNMGFENFGKLLANGKVMPLELGPGCAAVFGVSGGLPLLCMRGGAQFFPLNGLLSPGFTVEGTLTTASTDPFIEAAKP